MLNSKFRFFFGPALRSGGRRPDPVFERSEKTQGRANSEPRSIAAADRSRRLSWPRAPKAPLDKNLLEKCLSFRQIEENDQSSKYS
ncbi:hypothetical protein SGRA_0315 [Saprospira grandis str. Lewin]|uniref:Uncharacterized protein n=1 Tax=Saprospira grandis (strain Lewin) TaxID=984262 RepID=H6L7M2_SAPGL|nr:hypothetical protein SGRA_0315 [Saprospira grandis str. Lewin]